MPADSWFTNPFPRPSPGERQGPMTRSRAAESSAQEQLVHEDDLSQTPLDSGESLTDPHALAQQQRSVDPRDPTTWFS
eukprot:1587375-Rhodomonas_salina.1